MKKQEQLRNPVRVKVDGKDVTRDTSVDDAYRVQKLMTQMNPESKIEIVNEINSKLFVIKLPNRSEGKIIPTNRLFWKSRDGKNKNPQIKPNKIDKRANLNSIFFLKNP